MGDQNSIEYVLRTKAELQGAKDFRAELEKQIGVSKALGHDYSDLTEQLNHVTHAIAHAVPELGHFTRLLSVLARGGPVAMAAAGLAAAGTAVLAIRQKLLDFANAEVQVRAAVESTREAVDQSAISDKYRLSLETTAGAASLAAAQLEGLRGKMLALKSTEDEIANAAKDKDIQKVEADVATGKITKAEAEIRKAEIEGNHIKSGAARQKALLDNQERLGDIEKAVKEDSATAATGKVKSLRDALGGVDANKLGEMEEDRDRKAARLKELKSARDQYDKEYEEMRPKYEPRGFVEKFSRFFHSGGNLEELAKFKALKTALPTLDKDIALQEQKVAQASATVSVVKGNLAALPKLEEEAKRTRTDADTTGAKWDEQKKVIAGQRTAIDRVTSSQLNALSLRTGVSVLNAVNDQESKNNSRAVEILHERSLGLSGNVAPRISGAGQAVTRAIDQMGKTFQDSFEATMERILDSVKRVNDRVDRIQGRISRRELD